MSNHGPTHRVDTLIPRKDAEGQDDTFWLNIGAAFPHKDAKRYNLVFQAMPLDGGVRFCRGIAAMRDDIPSESGLGHKETVTAHAVYRRTTPGREKFESGFSVLPFSGARILETAGSR